MEIMYSTEPLEEKKKKFEQSKINEKFNNRVNLVYVISLIVVIIGFIIFSAVNYNPESSNKSEE